MKSTAIKLSDEQIRRFICDGVLVLESGVSSQVNERVFEKIQWNNTHEFNMGNNVLARIPELQEVLDSPVIHGALQSILGDEYVLHPHRFMHASEPMEADTVLTLQGDEHGPAMGKGSSGTSYWHQDAQSPLSRARYHVPRLALLLYFPQDTPMERGPTRVIPGTHLQARLDKTDYANAFVAPNIKAGTCLLVAFDIGHAGLTNLTANSRYMFKLVFMRTRPPHTPSWDHEVGRRENDAWQPPEERLARYDHTPAWSYIWDWLRGSPRSNSDTGHSSADSEEITTCMSVLNKPDDHGRLTAIYKLAALGPVAITPLVESLTATAGLGREFALPNWKDKGGQTVPDADPNERRWNEGAFALQDEAYALGAMGTMAVPKLCELLDHDDAWIKINAAFALGETGSATAVPALTAQLDHPLHQVVRQVLDAIACIGTVTKPALTNISRLLTTTNPDWQEVIGRGWSGEDQVRFNAMCALLNSDTPVTEHEELLVSCLKDRNGYVAALALELLTTRGTEFGMRHALDYLKTHRWDDTLAAGQRVY